MLVLALAVIAILCAAFVLWQLIEADLADVQAHQDEAVGEERSARA
jgi:hypothetical protein